MGGRLLTLGLLLLAVPSALRADVPDGFSGATTQGQPTELFRGYDWSGRYGIRAGFRHDVGPSIGRERGLSSFQVFLPLHETHDRRQLVFADSRMLLDSDRGTLGASLGIATRCYLPSLGRTFGGYAYYDCRDTGHATFHQVSGGIESLGAYWDFRTNWYAPVGASSAQVATTLVPGNLETRYYQSALTGLDLEAGRLLASPFGMELRAFAGLYHFQGEEVQQVWGWKTRLEGRIADKISLNLAVQDDELFGTTVNFGVSIFWPTSSARRQRSGRRKSLPIDRLGEPVERIQNIVVANYHRSYSLVPDFFIQVGDHTLLPGTPNQSFPIHVVGGEQVQGLNFYIQVGDGGAATGGSDVGPTIQAIDILSGTVFQSNNTGAFDIDGSGAGDLAPMFEGRETTTASGYVTASGLLGTVTIDTTGFTTGQTWDLIMSGTANGPADFAGVPVYLIDGTITIGP